MRKFTINDYVLEGSSLFTLSPDFDLVVNENIMTVTYMNISTGPGLPYGGDFNEHKKPEYHTWNITHRYTAPG